MAGMLAANTAAARLVCSFNSKSRPGFKKKKNTNRALHPEKCKSYNLFL
jgi:hypothetical protein